MRTASELRGSLATEFRGQNWPRKKSGAKSGPPKFADVARGLWGKRDAQIAAIRTIEKCSDGTARRILRGTADISLNLALAVVAEMRRPRDPVSRLDGSKGSDQ